MNAKNSSNTTNASNPKNVIWLWLLPLALFIYLYLPTFINIYKSWFTFWGSHGPLILGISLYLVWYKRKHILLTPRNPSIYLGAGFLLIGCLILIGGRLSFTKLIEGVSIVFTLFGLIGLMGGRKHIMILLIPVGYFIFLFPIFNELLGNISIVFQEVTARIAALVLRLSGQSVFRTDQFIQLPHISLEVAKSCNGINHIIALTALAIPMAYMSLTGRSKRIFLVVFAFFLAIFLNGLRVAAIGLWTKFSDGGQVHGPSDIFYVSIIFFLGMGILLLLTRFLAKKEIGKDNSIQLKGPEGESAGPAREIYKGKTKWAFFVGLLILGLTMGYLTLYKPVPVSLKQPLEAFPLIIGGWIGQETNPEDSLLKEVKTKDRLERVYQDQNGGEVNLSIRYFPIQDPGQKIVSYQTDILHEEAKTITISTTKGQAVVNAVFNKNSARIPFYFWYDIDSRMMTNRYQAKLESLFDAALKRKTNGAIVVISSDRPSLSTSSENDFLKKSIPIIHDFLKTD